MRYALVAAALSALALAAPAPAVNDPQVSTNWAGYAIGGGAGTSSFSDVTGTWTQPRVRCTLGRRDSVAFWVGLGGYDEGSQSLQQLGTEATCDGLRTTPTYSIWWEIVPAASVQVPLKLLPGDTVTAAVLVNGQKVTMSLKNLTRKTRFSKTVVAAHPLDVASAEWVAEAPALCFSATRCRVVPLTNFGSVTFRNAAAIGAGHPGTILDGSWEATPVQLITGSGRSPFFGRGDVLGPGVGAVPGDVTSDGRSFTITWQQQVTPPA